MFKKLDHIAIAVNDTDEALEFYQATLGLPLILSEVLKDVGVRLTHLDMGNVQLQLVEPLSDAHPIAEFIKQRGEGMHHLCWKVDDAEQAMTKLPDFGLKAKAGEPHPAPNGGKAAFIDPTVTRGVLWEMTG